jgi:hypothetical protein
MPPHDPPAFRFPVPRDIERLAFEAGVSLAALCRQAGVTPQSFRNWKFGRVSPSLDTVQRLVDAGTTLLAEAQGAMTTPPTSRRKAPAKPRAAAKKAPKPAATKRPARKRV